MTIAGTVRTLAHRSPVIVGACTAVLQWVTIVSALVRAWDYVTGPEITNALSVVTAAGPLDLWAALLVTGAGLAIAGILSGCDRLAEGGHIMLALTYLALGMGQAAATVEIWGFENARFWWPWLVSAPIVHFVYAHSYGGRRR